MINKLALSLIIGIFLIVGGTAEILKNISVDIDKETKDKIDLERISFNYKESCDNTNCYIVIYSNEQRGIPEIPKYSTEIILPLGYKTTERDTKINEFLTKQTATKPAKSPVTETSGIINLKEKK